LLVLAFAFLMAAFYTQSLKLERKFLLAQSADTRLAEALYMPPNEVVQVLSLGYEPLIADLVFMAANAYFTTHLLYDRKYTALDGYVDAIVGYCRDPGGRKLLLPPPECEAQAPTNRWVRGLFPFNPRVYLWASQVIKFAPLLTDSIIDRSTYYGRTGIEFCPDNWELYFDVGFNLYFEYKDKKGEERRATKMQALSYFEVAALLPNSDVDPNFLASNLWGKDETQRAILQIYRTYYHATPEQRQEIRSRARVYGQQELASFFENEESAWQRQFPYIPLHLFHVVGAPMLPESVLAGPQGGQDDPG
jgi:hypothetical protein